MTMIPKVHTINRPIKVGEVVLVPIVNGTPCLWPPHTDVEDGQPHTHWHADPRFTDRAWDRPTGKHTWEPRVAVAEFGHHTEHGVEHTHVGATNVDFIKRALLKIPRASKRITKAGRCPHRGFNLLQVKPHNGKVICPMHSMRFHACTGQGIPYRYRVDDDEWRVMRDSR